MLERNIFNQEKRFEEGSQKTIMMIAQEKNP